MTIMFDSAETVGVDCCEGDHRNWELLDHGYDRHHQHVTRWICPGCGHTVTTDVERDRLNHPVYVDPDGTAIEMTRPNRPRHR